MSIDPSGLDSTIEANDVVVVVSNQHPLIQLGNALPWKALADLIMPDLQSTTTKRKWWMGRPLRLRIHLGAYLLQQLHNHTDRKTEYSIKDNAAYQLFCGQGIVNKWHFPDHTKIEEFRSRLSPDTQKKLANAIASQAVFLGFADPSHIDIDSTVQEANMQYPTDSSLLCKLGAIAKRIASYLNENFSVFTNKPMEVNLRGIKSVARRYFFYEEKRNKRRKE